MKRSEKNLKCGGLQRRSQGLSRAAGLPGYTSFCMASAGPLHRWTAATIVHRMPGDFTKISLETIIVEALHTTIFNKLRLRSCGLLLRYSRDQIMITEAHLHYSTCSKSFRVAGSKDISDAELSKWRFRVRLPTVIPWLYSNNRDGDSFMSFWLPLCLSTLFWSLRPSAKLDSLSTRSLWEAILPRSRPRYRVPIGVLRDKFYCKKFYIWLDKFYVFKRVWYMAWKVLYFQTCFIFGSKFYV